MLASVRVRISGLTAAGLSGQGEYFITSRELFMTLRQQYLAGALTEASLFPALAAGLDHALFALKEGVGHADLQLTCDVLDHLGAVAAALAPVALSLKYGPDQPPSYAAVHADRQTGLPVGWDRAVTKDGRAVYLVRPAWPPRRPLACHAVPRRLTRARVVGLRAGQDHVNQRTTWVPPPAS